MKKIISLSTVIMLGFASFAQDTIPKTRSHPNINNNMDTMHKNNNLPRDTSSNNWNKPHRTDSTNSTTLSSDSSYNNSNNANSSTNTTMTNDSSSMSHNNHNGDSLTKMTTRENSTSSSTSVATNTADSIKAYEKTLTDRVMMKDDKMYMLKDGEATLLEKSFKLSSGAVVSTTGKVKYPGGRVITLKNGQFIEIKPLVTDNNTKQVDKEKKSSKTVVTKKKTKTQSK